MKKAIFLILFALLVLSACGTKDASEEQSAPEGNQASETENKTEEETNTDEQTVRTPTEEDEKFTELLLARDYETLIKETIGFESDSQKDFYNLASALKKHDEIQTKSYVDETTNEKNYSDLISDYKVIVLYINKVDYIPEEMKAEFEDMKKEAEEKIVQNQEELDKQTQGE
jgi:outer membrane lipoprotein-sorting protein